MRAVYEGRKGGAVGRRKLESKNLHHRNKTKRERLTITDCR